MENQDKEQELIDQFKRGNREAADKLIQKYFERVVRVAEKKLASRNQRVTSGDDVAVSVFDSLWKKASEKQFAEKDLASPEELWRLISVMIGFKTEDHVRKMGAQKRGGGNVRGESVFYNPNQSNIGFNAVDGGGLSPDQVVELKESYTDLMKELNDDVLQKVAVLRMEGFSVAEIAKEFDRSERFVKRKLALIRNIWNQQIEARRTQ